MQKIVQILNCIIEFFYRPFSKIIPLQMFKYAACGGGNMLLDWVLYFVIYNFIIGHELVYIDLCCYNICITPHIAALCIVFPITTLTGFLLNKYITFTNSMLANYRQFIRYILIVFVNLSINYFGLKLFVELLEWYPTPSKIVITLLTILISFCGQKYFTFK